jgi:hypothetical protein
MNGLNEIHWSGKAAYTPPLCRSSAAFLSARPDASYSEPCEWKNPVKDSSLYASRNLESRNLENVMLSQLLEMCVISLTRVLSYTFESGMRSSSHTPLSPQSQAQCLAQK